MVKLGRGLFSKIFCQNSTKFSAKVEKFDEKISEFIHENSIDLSTSSTSKIVDKLFDFDEFENDISKINECGFCGGKNHEPEDCSAIITFPERNDILINFDGFECFFCHQNLCKCSKNCQVCFGNHHIAVCPRYLSSKFFFC